MSVLSKKVYSLKRKNPREHGLKRGESTAVFLAEGHCETLLLAQSSGCPCEGHGKQNIVFPRQHNSGKLEKRTNLSRERPEAFRKTFNDCLIKRLLSKAILGLCKQYGNLVA